MSVHPITYHLEVASSDGQILEGLDGYVGTVKSWIQVTAWLDPKLSQNLNSYSFVKHLGLVIHPPDEHEEPFWIRIDEDEDKQALGSLMIDWSEDENFQDGGFPVHCLVYYSEDRGRIIFGVPLPFLSRRAHHLKRPSINTRSADK